MKHKIANLINSKVFKNGIWLSLLQLVNTVVPLITIPYITRILGTNEYGLFSIALNWILYVQVFVEFGFGLNGARKVALLKETDHKKLNKLYNNIISSRIILFIISFIILNVIALFSQFNIKIYLSMMVLFVMIIGTTFQLTWLFQGKQDMKFITIVNVVSRLISVLLIFLLVKTSSDLYLYCFLYSITLLLSSAISIWIAHKKYKLKYKFSNVKEIKEELNDAKHLFASSAMAKIFNGFGTTVLGIISTASITGIYSAIYKIPFVLTMIFSPISQAMYPHSSTILKNNFEKGSNKIKKICIPIFTIFLIPSIVIVLLRNPIINALFGSEYTKYSIVVVPLVAQFLLAIINNFLGIQILVASGNKSQYSKSLLIGCLAIVILNYSLGKIFGIYGVAMASVVSEAILSISLYYNYRKVRRNHHD